MMEAVAGTIVSRARMAVDRYGLAVMDVEADPVKKRPGYAYSVGLSSIIGTEIMVERLSETLARALIYSIYDACVQGNVSLDRGCMLVGAIQGGLPIALIDTDETNLLRERPMIVDEVLGTPRPFKVLQLVVPDQHGRFFWDKGYVGDTQPSVLWYPWFCATPFHTYVSTLPRHDIHHSVVCTLGSRSRH